jgi:isopenicillin N synthase-like dioxygenase
MDRTVGDDDVAIYADFDNRYLRHDRTRLASLPTVDLAAPWAARDLRKACIDIGFSYLTGHGFGAGEIDALLDWGRRFFALPRERKMALLYAEGRGYVPAGGLGAKSDRAPDIKERLYLAREFPAAAAIPANHLWPDEQDLPGFRDAIKRFLDKAVQLTQRVGETLALSLALDPNYFAREHGPFGCTLTFNYYPPLDPATIDRTQWSFSPHTDYGSFALVFQDGLGGLQVRNAGGAWIDVTPVEGAIVFNIGDLMALASNDLYTSNLHRVANFSSHERISATLFVGPPGGAVIGCLPTCEGPGNPARYAPVNAEDYTRALIEAYHRTGRPALAPQTTRRFRRR